MAKEEVITESESTERSDSRRHYWWWAAIGIVLLGLAAVGLLMTRQTAIAPRLNSTPAAASSLQVQPLSSSAPLSNATDVIQSTSGNNNGQTNAAVSGQVLGPNSMPGLNTQGTGGQVLP